jgi:CHAT domain-containing protein/Tfp pilus assembly protein PilF
MDMVLVLRRAFPPMAIVLCLLPAHPSYAFVQAATAPADEVARKSGEPALDRLADALVMAAPGDRAALLAGEPSLVTPALVTSLIDRGVRLFNRSELAPAEEVFRMASDVAAGISDRRGLGRALTYAGRAAMELRELERAREYLARGLETFQNIGDDAGIASAASNLGASYQREDKYYEAQQLYERALEAHKKLDDPPARARVLLALGQTNFYLGRQAESIPLYRQALEIRTALNDRAGMAGVHNSLGTVYRDQGDYVRASEHYFQSLVIRESLGNENDIAYTLNNIGIFYKEQGNYRQALETYSRALANFERTGNRDGISRVLVNIGVVYQEQADYDRALAYAGRALEIKQTLKERLGVAIVLGNIGDAHRGRGNYSEAVTYYDRAMKLFQEIGDQSAVAIGFVSLGDVAGKQGRYAEGLELAERGKRLAEKVGRDEIVWQSQLVAATMLRAMKEPAKARIELEGAIGLIEALRTRVAGDQQAQQLFFESKLAPYHALVDLLVEQNTPADALMVVERAKARALLDVVQSGRVDVTSAMTPAEREQEAALSRRLAALNNERFLERTRPTQDVARVKAIEEQLDQARLALEAFQTALFATHPEIRLRRGETAPMSAANLRDLLPDANRVLLEFLVTEKSTFLFVVRLPRGEAPTGGGAAALRVAVYRVAVTQKALASRVAAFRQMLATVDNRYAPAARDLYDTLLAPAAAEIRGASRLVIVPDGPLWDLPFQVLRTPRSEDLIDRYAISSVPSLSVLHESMSRRARRQAPTPSVPTAFGLGNPALGGDTIGRVEALMDERLEPLPEAERQVRALARLYGSTRSTVYVGSDASEERFKAAASSFRVLHVATHGILNDQSPMYSHLVLAQRPGAAEDGLLEAREIIQLDLTADVAVLSACETARGRVGRGEGMIGLTWAMFVAGVPTTIVSQWKVRSDSTADLMIAFHRRLRTQLARPPGQRDVAGALRLAALEIKRDPRYRHPFHWAPFVVIGDGN